MLSFAAICPHPPIIIPGLGSTQNEKAVQETVKSLNQLHIQLQDKDLQTIIVISPHGPISRKEFTIITNESRQAHLRRFGFQKAERIFTANASLIEKIITKTQKHNIPLRTFSDAQVDHGAFVPLYFLTQQKPKINLVELTYSGLDRETHLRWGQVLYEIIQESSENIGFIASGDLSHRLSKQAPAGYSPKGKKFDQDLLEYIKNKDMEAIINMDTQLVQQAGQCGYRSILVLLGILSKMDKDQWSPQILSYQAPFGVGYAVVNFRL